MNILVASLLVVFAIFASADARREPSNRCYEIIKDFEGLRLRAYQDVAEVWTIGYGTTYYQDGSKVKGGDVISLSQANNLLVRDVDKFARGVDSAVGSGVYLKQQQFDALVSFSYNLGLGALRRSSLLKLVKANPNNGAIREEFMKFVNAGGRFVRGLHNRRQREANLYFS